jgi:hypothetical protein
MQKYSKFHYSVEFFAPLKVNGVLLVCAGLGTSALDHNCMLYVTILNQIKLLRHHFGINFYMWLVCNLLSLMYVLLL